MNLPKFRSSILLRSCGVNKLEAGKTPKHNLWDVGGGLWLVVTGGGFGVVVCG